MPYPKAPCKNCEERHIGCHSECSSYKEFRSSVDELRAKKREEAERNLRSRSKAHSRAKYYKQKV